MREIKFRGRGAYQRSIWYVGDLVKCDDGRIVIRKDEANEFYVDPETVGQFTGLKDAVGREIYEGDVLFVKAENPYWSKFDSKHVVTWCNDGWILNDYGTDDPGLFHILMNSDCEIIGNAYDNSELLEGDN